MKRHNKQNGFTSFEILIILVFAVAWIAGAGSAGYVAFHFINKIW